MDERLVAIFEVFWDAAVNTSDSKAADHCELLYNWNDRTQEEIQKYFFKPMQEAIQNGTLK